MDAYVKTFIHQNRLFIKIKKLETEEQASFLLKSSIEALREMDNAPDIIFDIRGYEVSEMHFEYEFLRRFFLVMCLKSPRSIIRLGVPEVIGFADEIFKALNVRLDSYVFTADEISTIRDQLLKRSDEFDDLISFFNDYDFNTIVTDGQFAEFGSDEYAQEFDQTPVYIKSVSIEGDQVPNSQLTIKIEASSEQNRVLYYRYYYKKTISDKYATSYKFVGDYEWTKESFCKFSIPQEGRYQFFAEAAVDPLCFDKPDTSYTTLPLLITRPLIVIDETGEYFAKGQYAELVMLTKDLRKKVVQAKIDCADYGRNLVELINLEPGLDFSEYKKKFILSCVLEKEKGIYRYAFRSMLVNPGELKGPLALNEKLKIEYEDDPKKVNLRKEFRYKITEKDNVILYLYYEGGLFSSGKIFEVVDLSTGGFGIRLNSTSNNSLSEMKLKTQIKTQLILTPDTDSDPVIISPRAELRWKGIDEKNDTGKMGFAFYDIEQNMRKEIQYYTSLKML